MKKINVLLASLGALAVASSASAQTYVRLSGSTAFRAATHSAIGNILAPGYTVGYVGTDLSSAAQAIYTGNVGTVPVIIKTSWTGSNGGVYALATTPQITPIKNFLADSTPAGAGAAAALLTDTNPSNVAMSDNAQSSSSFADTSVYENLNATKVGVVTFVWATGTSDTAGVASAITNITNIQALQANQLLTAGQLPLSQLSGNSADTAKIYLVGRDEDSGTRIVTFQECGFGAFSNPLQYDATIDTTVVPNKISGIKTYPANTVLGVNWAAGHSGYASGGNVRDRLNANVQVSPKRNNVTQAAGFALIGYLGISDATKLTREPLAYNGVKPFTNWASNPKVQNDTAVREGTYTFWSYEYLFTRNDIDPTAASVAATLATQITNVDAELSGTKLSTMNVSRSAEGTLITHN